MQDGKGREWFSGVWEMKEVMSPLSHDQKKPQILPNKRCIYLLVGNVGQHSGNDLQQENTHQQTQIL